MQEDERAAMLNKQPSSWRSFASFARGGFGAGGLSSSTATRSQDFIALEIGGLPAGRTHRGCPEEQASWLSRLFFVYVDPLMKAGAARPLQQADLWDMAHRDEAETVCRVFNRHLRNTAQPSAPQGVVWKALWRAHGGTLIWTGCLKIAHDMIMFSPPFLLEQLLKHMADSGSRHVALGWACLMLLAAVVENITINIYFHALFRLSLHIKTELIQMIYEKALRITSSVKSEMGSGNIHNLQSNDAAKLWGTPTYLHVLWNGPFQILVVMAMLVRLMGWAPALAGLSVTILIIPLTTLLGRAIAKVRRQMLTQTDARVKLASEIVTGIKAIKLYAWEDAYTERITSLRDTELRHIRNTQLLSMLNGAVYNSGPIFVALAAFAIYAWREPNSLSAAKAFPALALFNLLRFPITMLPTQIMNMIHARVGLQRIQAFMQANEMCARSSMLATASSAVHPSVSITIDDDAAVNDTAPLLGHPSSTSPLPSPLPPTTATPNRPLYLTTSGPTAAGQNAASYAAPTGGLHSVVSELRVAGLSLEGVDVSIRVHGGAFAWDPHKDAVLHDVSISVQEGELVMVVGQVGSGKSSLLQALLGEMHMMRGQVQLCGSCAYTAQDPWIQNSSLRNNVLMGKSYEEDWYADVLAACALGPDLEMLAAGDATEIGEKGVNLSGGQKHRVALARACYADADIYLFDDPLSAVDAHVGRILFEECICGLLAGHTRVLVTHQLQYLPAADKVVVMSDGRIQEVGTYQQLQQRGVDLNKFVKSKGDSQADSAEETDPQQDSHQQEEQQEEIVAPAAAAAAAAGPLESLALIDLEDDNEQTVEFTEVQQQQQQSSPLHQSPFERAVSVSEAGNMSGPLVTQNKAETMADSCHSSSHSEIQSENSTAVVAQLMPVSSEARSGKAAMRRAQSRKNLLSMRMSLQRTMQHKEQEGKLVKVEERAVGQVDRAIYRAYIDAWSEVWLLLPLAVVVLAFIERGLQVGQNYVLSFWTNDTTRAEKEGDTPHTKFWLSLYFMLGMLSIGMQLVRAIATITGSIRASRTLHARLLHKLVRLPMNFFDSQPTGRLLNRMTKDTEAVDVQVSGSVNSALQCLVNAVLSLLVVAAVTPAALAAVVPMAYFYFVIQKLYIASSRELKRLDALNFSPIFSHFGESLHGLATIRAFNKQQLFLHKNKVNLDASNRAYWPIQVVNRWLSVRIEMMGACIVWVTAVCVAVIFPASPGLVGLAITSALNLTGILGWMVRQMTELEVNMNSVERMVEYLKYDEEAPAVVAGKQPPATWPHAGGIEAVNLSVRYRPDLDPVLRSLSFQVHPREKIGVCGRTGCGKSTLMITLYRLIEPCGGTMFIDGIDITSIGLKDLRSRLSLVPQDPVIFSGTIRSNLDPFSSIKGDDPVWSALRRAGLEEFVKGLSGGLDATIKEGGANLSVGQRQLLCMARALLRASRIMVLDEATSNVDNATDTIVQNTIRTAFADCTVLTIAHRLHTIIDSDRILVLDAGQLAEFDSPRTLLQQPASAFRKLVEETTKGGGLNADAVKAAFDSALGGVAVPQLSAAAGKAQPSHSPF